MEASAWRKRHHDAADEKIKTRIEEEKKKRELAELAKVPWRMLEAEIKKLSEEVEKKRQVEKAKDRLNRLEKEARAKLQSQKEKCELREKRMEKQIKILRNVDSALTSAIIFIPNCASNIRVSIGSLYGKFTSKLSHYAEMQAQILYEISLALKSKNKK